MTVNGQDVEARYCQALLGQQEVSKVALADGRLVEVKDIYLNRTLLHEVVQKQPEGEITVKLPVDLWPKLQDERVVLVEGPAGMGKSTLTKQLVRESETHHRIPIWIPFRLFVASGLSILEYLDQCYIPWLGLSDLRVPNRANGTGPDHSLGQWCYDQWQSGLGVLILDGLDEVFRHEERATALRGLPITGTGRTRPATILTSRPLSQSLPLQRVKIDLQGLTPSDQIQFIEQYRASLQLTEAQVGHFTRATTEREHSRFRELLTRPGHLIQILTTYARSNTLLDTETAVLNSLLESRLSITDRIEPPVEGGDAKKKRQVLLSLALHLLDCRQGQRQTRAQLLALIKQVLLEQKQAGTPLFPLSQATAILNDLTRNSALLTEVEPEVYEFETVIWLQHLAGSALANGQTITALQLTESHVLDVLNKKAWDPEWEPVLKSWVGNAERPFPLFRRLIDKQHDDLARHRLGLAGRCLSEVRLEQKPLSQHRKLATRVAREAFLAWKANAKWNSSELMSISLGRAWVKTEIGQTQLLAMLQAPSSMMKRQIIKTRRLLQPIIPSVMQRWLEKAAYQDEAVRESAAEALRGLGMAMPVNVQEALVEQLGDADVRVRGAAARALGELGEAMSGSVQEALVERLADPYAGVRQRASMALSGARNVAMSVNVQEALVAQLGDADLRVRGAAASGLSLLGPAMPGPVQKALVERLVDPYGSVRGLAALALGQLGTAMPVNVQEALKARLTDSDFGVRSTAASALWQRGTEMPGAVQEALTAQLADLDGHVREVAVVALGQLGTAMPGAVQEALLARLVDSNPRVRNRAIEALFRREGVAMSDSMQRALLPRLVDPDRNVRQAAAEALGTMRAAMPNIVQRPLVARLADLYEEEDVRIAVAEALGQLGTAMPGAVQEALVARLRDFYGPVRGAAARALGELGAAMPRAVQEALVVRLADPDEGVRRHVVWTLGQLGAVMPIIVQEALVARLVDLDVNVRQAAVEALGQLGAAMPIIVQEALMVRLIDLKWAVRKAAVSVLSTAQQQGLRFFLHGNVLRAGRLVSELSATVPFPDLCQDGVMHASTALAISAPHRLPLTVV